MKIDDRKMCEAMSTQLRQMSHAIADVVHSEDDPYNASVMREARDALIHAECAVDNLTRLM